MKEKENEEKNNETVNNEAVKNETVKENEKVNIGKEEEKKYKEPDLPTLFIWFISMLSGKVWEYLGLMMNPDTKEIKKDLPKAKIAIDSISFLYEQVKDELMKEDVKRIEDLLANLKMNYVEKLKEK